MTLRFKTLNHEFGRGEGTQTWSNEYDFKAPVRSFTAVLNGWNMNTGGEYTTKNSVVNVVAKDRDDSVVHYDILFGFSDDSGNWAGATVYYTLIADVDSSAAAATSSGKRKVAKKAKKKVAAKKKPAAKKKAAKKKARR